MSERRNETPTVILGFASFKDGSFELIVQDEQTFEETILKGRLDSEQFKAIDRILPTCVFVKAKCKSTPEQISRAYGLAVSIDQSLDAINALAEHRSALQALAYKAHGQMHDLIALLSPIPEIRATQSPRGR